MIKVYPKIELQVMHIFKNSAGQRLTLQPAETMDDVGKTPQEFDGEDPVVAAKIMEQLEAKTVRVSKEDRKVLEKTLAAVPEDAEDEPESKATKKEVKEAVSKAVEAADAEHEKAVEKLTADHAKALEKLAADAAGNETGAADALAKANADHAEALQKAADDAEADKNEALAKAAESHKNAVDKLNTGHAKALEKASK